MGILVRDVIEITDRNKFPPVSLHDHRRILIDIKHPAQLNLFKGLAKELSRQDWDVTICYLNRGKLPKIIDIEYAGFKTIPVGSSRGTRWSIFWNGNIKRTASFIKIIKKGRFDICIAASSVPLAVAGRILGVPVIQFYDDPERKRINYLNAMFSDQIFFPPVVQANRKVSVFNCLKEWSYLSPKHFTPNPGVLSAYSLVPHEYVFIREVSNKSFNYFGQQDSIVSSLSKEINKNAVVVLSLEDKSIAHTFPESWIILQEPVADIHSLIYFSKLVVSSGDSMAREGAMLGVPSIYCGTREMKANKVLIDFGVLQHLPGATMVKPVNQVIDLPFNIQSQERLRKQLFHAWDDMVDFMKEQIERYKKSESFKLKTI